MKRLFLLLIFSLLFPFSFSQCSYAADIPRDDLRLELLLTTGSLDTSGLNRVVTSTGGGPRYKIDPSTNMPHAQFGGTGGLTAVTGWNGSISDDFTVSFWIKVRSQDLPTSTGMYFPPNSFLPGVGYLLATSTQYLATIFSSHMSPTSNAFSIRLRKDFQCMLGGVKQPSTYYLDSINHPTVAIDCSKLNDNKWHFIGAKRYNKIFTLQIDSDVIFSGSVTNDMSIGRILSIGYFPLPANTGALAYQMGQDYRLTNAHSYFTGSLAKFRLYSRALSVAEVMTLRDENIISQSEFTGTGNIGVSLQSYIAPNVQLTLSGLPSNLSKTLVTYQFLVNSGAYQDIPSNNIVAVTSSSGLLAYIATINLSTIPDGLTNIQLRTKSMSGIFQSIGTLKFTKIDQIYGINILEPNASLSLSKNLSASINGTGILMMAITRGNTCDGNLQFETYSDLVFTSKSDNFTRVCYRAQYPNVNKTIYKLSNAIQGITGASNSLTGSKIFDDYQLWTSSSYAKFNDIANTVLDLLAVNASGTNGTINGVTLTDINGDGLVDFIYSRSDPIRRAIIVNNGNYTFRVVYKCAMDWSPITYFGDCADPSR